MDKFIGKRLDGRYEIRDIIGIGGMAVVYKAYDNIEDRIVAIKILKEEFSTNDEFLRRFKNESKAIAVLSHPNIVKVFDVSFGEIFQYIVMEYIDGITLKTFIENQGSLHWNEAINFTTQILRGLQHAHDKGIVHRDIKPQNIMVLPDGTIKVTDFGIARFARNEHKTITDKVIGSVHYISPEQAKGEPTDEKTDMYSVGVMLYEMLTGKLPFEADSAVSVAIMQLQTEAQLPTEINPSIPLGVEQITLRAMRKDASERYSSAAEMLRDLERIKKDPDLVFDNHVFIDNSPTRFIEKIDAEDSEDEVVTKKSKGNEKKATIPVLTGVAIAFGAALVIFLIVIMCFLFAPSEEAFDCPNFVGEKYENLVRSEKYTIEKVEVHSSNAEYGVIYEQTPDAGTKIKDGATIKVYVSLGQKIIKVPALKDFDISRAIMMLKTEGLEYEIIERSDDRVAANTVIETVPAADSNVNVGTKITVYVSTGSPIVYVDLPNVVNLSLEDAKKLIERNGLVVGNIEYVESDINKKDIVVEQDPVYSDSNAQIGKGTTVNLKVGSGEKTNNISLKIPLPKDYVNQYGTISYWINSGKVDESNELDFYNGSDYTFNISTKEEVIDILVKINAKNSSTYEDYSSFKINAKTGEILASQSFAYSKKEAQWQISMVL